LDGFKVFVFKDRSREIASLQTEQVLGTLHPVTGLYEPVVMQQLEQDTGGKVKAIILPNQQIAGTLLNFNHPPFDNPKVRRAVFLAIDRRELIKTAELGIGDQASFFQPGVVFTPEETSQWPGYRYVDAAGEVVTNPLERDDVVKDPRDIEEAQALIKEAGAEGFSGTMGGVNFGRASKHAQVLAQQLKRNLGWDITLALSDIPTQAKERRARTHALHHGGTFGPTLPLPDVLISSVYRPGGSRNTSGWSNPRIEELAEAHLQELDPAERQKMLKEIVEVLKEGESQFVPMIWLSAGGALNVKIRNWHAGATTPNYQTVHKLEHIWFDPNATP
jgi:peptide/nickel transport system substrate-binding protein